MINKTFYISILLLSVLLFTNCQSTKKQNSDQSIHQIETLSDDGAWCWFSNPRAIYYSENEVITGWVKKDGSVELASLNLSTGQKEFENIYPKMQVDDHNNPAFVKLSDGNILTMYAWHATKDGVISNTSTKGSDIHSFGDNVVFKPKTDELLERFPRETYTYANPCVLEAENNKVFAFGRWTGFKPNLIISDDNGKSWSEKYVIISDDPFTPGNRPYVNYFSDGKSKVHLIFTDGHPRNEATNSVYYCYYENGAFWKVDDSKICDLDELPFTVNDASLVYKATEETGRAWIADIVVQEEKPYILYSRHPEETDHRYHYAWYDANAGKWNDFEICKAGKWFPQTPEGEIEREPHYMGNMTVNPNKPNEIYLSREINKVFEIEKFTTQDNGSSWEIKSITQNSELDNVRPYIPRYQTPNSKTVVLWMENKKYIHYTDFDTRIKYIVEDTTVH
jgi:hypothetical protein